MEELRLFLPKIAPSVYSCRSRTDSSYTRSSIVSQHYVLPPDETKENNLH